MQLRMHPDALTEFAFAVAHYERQQTGLGLRFLANVESALQHIAADPLAWPILADDVRRHLTRTFPYAILFCIDADAVLVLAVMHSHQRPGYWRTRVTEP